MTPKQRVHLLADLWPRACRCQGWPAGDRALRLRVLSAAVGRPVGSARELDNSADFDAVKAHLGMLADNLAATIETDRPDLGRARRWRAVIRRQLADLRQYHPAPDALLADLLRDKFGPNRTLDDLSGERRQVPDETGQPREAASELEQVMFTLARIAGRRQRTGPGVTRLAGQAG